MTNRVTNGEQVTVFGYGACGRGVAASFRGAYAALGQCRRYDHESRTVHEPGH